MAHQAIRIGTGHDVNAPTVPTISASVLSATSARVSLTEGSSDASGIGEYRLERSLNGSSGWSQIAAGLSIFPYDDTDLDPETAYYYRARSADAASVPNVSGYSGTTNITTPAANEWTNPNPWLADFSPAGTPKSISFAQFVPPGSSNYRLHESSAPLPAGVTLDSDNKQLVYDGSGGAISDVTGVIIEDYTPGGGGSADWQSRISGPGVVWYHSFDTAAEVSRFCWTGGYSGGNNPNQALGGQYLTHQASGGADGGGFMRLTYPMGGGSGIGNSYWWRPFSAITGATNGKGVNDPGANGAHTPQAWNPTDGSTTTLRWSADAPINPGFFGPAAAVAANPTKYYGTDFYIQMRVRRAQTPGPPPDAPPFSYITGKSAWINITLDTSTANEIVVYGQSAGEDSVGQQGRHRMYEGRNRSGGPGIGGTNETDTINNSDSPSDWRYSGGWDTLLYHVTPGTHNGTGANRTRLEVWAAHPGETSYTKIWDVLYSAGYQQSANTVGSPPYDGWNALILAIYHNGSAFNTTAFNFDYDQVIFSKEMIPCPQA